MSLDSAKKFLAELEVNEELQKKIEACSEVEQRVKVAQEAGFEFTKTEIQTVLKSLSDDDLDSITGGTRSHTYRGFL